MNILDNLERIRELDKQDMLGVEENFYSQLLEAKKIAESTALSQLKNKNFSGMAILGMGGSGFTGDIIKSLIIDHVEIPVEIVKGYDLPAFINKDWLVIAVSYSGNTEETISAANQALQKNCEFLCVASGGKIEEIALKNGKCFVRLPSGFQPRGASGYLFFTTYLVLKNLGIVNVNDIEIEEALNLIRKKSEIYKRGIDTDNNPAKKLALKLFNNMPVIYGTDGYLSAVAFRWKCEFNENSKYPGFWAEFPELNHNETVGWENLKDITKNFVLIVFRDAQARERIKVRIKTTIQLIKSQFRDVVEIDVEGKTKLAKALSTMYLGDITSVYLALLGGVDPTPVERISVLKAELAKLDK
ncbi:MAG: bifunctional phosphoglucose/phosphomannose isomerase [Actinobacteria bacterium]|nr:bifunctional phosphoglucose/phosphomannose isomerase [Actinomycetota bacterium]